MTSSKKRPIQRDLAVAYLRVSTDEQSLGPEAQRAAIERWAAVAGVTVASWHVDRVSGGTPVGDRPGLLDALQSLSLKRAGLLVAAKRDRLARDVVIAATLERLVQQSGATVVTADGVSTDDTPEGALMRTLLDAFSQYERALIRSRTRSALAVKRSRGERISGRPPVGFRFEGKRLVPVLGEQDLIVRVRSLRERGLSLERIAMILNKEQVRLRGGKIHPTTLARVLRRAAA